MLFDTDVVLARDSDVESVDDIVRVASVESEGERDLDNVPVRDCSAVVDEVAVSIDCDTDSERVRNLVSD